MNNDQNHIIPVLIAPLFWLSHSGTMIPSMIDTPRMRQLRGDAMLTYFRFESATDKTTPRPTVVRPPMTGSGIMVNAAPTLPKIATKARKNAERRYTDRLATYS